MIAARIIPPDEWERLSGQALAQTILRYVSPQNTAFVVVERDGEIVAKLGTHLVTMFEDLWIRPDQRGNPGVMRALVRQAFAIPRERGESWAIAMSGSVEAAGLFDHVGQAIEATAYAIAIEG
jgi:hypothetical protein